MFELRSGKVDSLGTPANSDSYSWEKELAPKISRGYVVGIAAIYCLWIGFLSLVAIQRWFGSLQ